MVAGISWDTDGNAGGAEGLDFLAWVPFEGTPLLLTVAANIERCVELSKYQQYRGLKTPSPCWISSVFTFTGTSHRTKAQEGAMCVSVCVCTAAAAPPA